jgi:hypothetical protein
MAPWLHAEEQPTTSTANADPVVMTVNGEPVSTAEYTLVMRRHVAEVFSYFHEKSGLEDHFGYWKDDGRAENPIRKLHAATADELRRLKTVQHFAKKKDLISDISYAGFTERLTKENARRQNALANNQVVYGPKQQRAEPYYYYQQRDLEQALMEALVKGSELTVSDAEIENFYLDQKKGPEELPLSELRPRIIAELQKRKFEALIADLVANAKVEINTEVLKGIAPRHDP